MMALTIVVFADIDLFLIRLCFIRGEDLVIINAVWGT